MRIAISNIADKLNLKFKSLFYAQTWVPKCQCRNFWLDSGVCGQNLISKFPEVPYILMVIKHLKDGQSLGEKNGRVRKNNNCTTTEYNI